jgi:hypothetical protein
VTGTPQLKTLCFMVGDKRVYKGEGTIQFTCYCPFAHTPNAPTTITPKALKKNDVIKCYLFYPKEMAFINYNDQRIEITYTILSSKEIKKLSLSELESRYINS